MRPQYVFSIVMVVAIVAVIWRPARPAPVITTRTEEGLEVRITKNAPPHVFEELPVHSFTHPPRDVFLMPKSYLRGRLCAGDDVMVAAAQARMLISPGEGEALGSVVRACGEGSLLCPVAAAALREDGGLTTDELRFFAEALIGCDRHHAAELRFDRRLPLEVRERAWGFLTDAGEWSAELGALVDEHLGTNGPKGAYHFRLATLLQAVSTESPDLLDASTRLMDRAPHTARLFSQARSRSVREAACARTGCDAGVEDEGPHDPTIDRREELAACVLQGAEEAQGACLDVLAELDWSMAKSVAERTSEYSVWRGALLAFATRGEFDEFARSFGAATQPDGGFHPETLLRAPGPEGLFHLHTADGLGTDELAAQWAGLSPELKGAFFFESSDEEGGLRLSGRIGDELYEVSVRREKHTLDPRAALALVNTMAAERGSARRFALLSEGWKSLAIYAEPERVAKLTELGLIELLDLDEARDLED